MMLKVLLQGMLLGSLVTAVTAQSVAVSHQVTANSQTESCNPTAIRIAPGTFIWAEISRSLDARRNRVGDPVEAKTSVDLLAQGKIVLPRNTKVLGQVTSVKPRTKQSPASYIAITFDHLVLGDGQELKVELVLQAMAGPLHSFYQGKESSEEIGGVLPPVGTSAPRATTMGNTELGQIPGRQYPARSSNPSETVLRSIPGSPRVSSALGPLSQGAVGLNDILLTSVDRVATISSNTQNLHIDGQSQLLLKTQ